MLSFSNTQRYYWYATPVDMRKGVSGLCGVVRQHRQHDLMSGDVFIFINSRRDRIKLLRWDSTGFALYYKQLEKGTFELPPNGAKSTIQLPWVALAMLLEGVEIKGAKHRKRYQKVG